MGRDCSPSALMATVYNGNVLIFNIKFPIAEKKVSISETAGRGEACVGRKGCWSCSSKGQACVK